MTAANTAAWQGLALDLAIVLSATLLGALKVLPSEAIIAIISAIGGARVATRSASSTIPPGASTGMVAAIILGALTLGRKT